MVSKKSFVSYSKSRGVNEISPNPLWLCDVVTVWPDGLIVGKPLSA
jgi:hypothetical protein